MKSQSAKAKGRRHQQAIAKLLLQYLPFLKDSDVKSLPMGSQGMDVWLSSWARQCFPFAIEAKNVEKLNIWGAWEQAKTHAEKEELKPMVVFSRNRSDILVTMKFEDLLEIIGKQR